MGDAGPDRPRLLVVTQAGQPTPPAPDTTGLLGLAWRIEEAAEHRACPQMIGYHPDRPDAVIARAKWLTLPGYADTADLQVGAALWTDYDAGAAALMAADIELATADEPQPTEEPARKTEVPDLLAALQASVDRAREARPDA